MRSSSLSTAGLQLETAQFAKALKDPLELVDEFLEEHIALMSGIVIDFNAGSNK